MSVDYDRLAKLAEDALFADDAKWAFADELLAEFPAPDVARATSAKANTGLYAELEKVAPALSDRMGKVVKVQQLRQLRAVAIAWPPEERRPEVSFRVYSKHRSPGAKAKLGKILAACEVKERQPNELLIEGARVVKKRDPKIQTWEEKMTARVDRLLKECDSVSSLDNLETIITVGIRERRKTLK